MLPDFDGQTITATGPAGTPSGGAQTGHDSVVRTWKRAGEPRSPAVCSASAVDGARTYFGSSGAVAESGWGARRARSTPRKAFS